MPAKSRKQQQMMAIAEHNPGALYAKNKGVLNMSHEQLHDFAATKGAPKVAKPKAAKAPKMEVESHAYDFRKARGRRAPLRMQKA